MILRGDYNKSYGASQCKKRMMGSVIIAHHPKNAETQNRTADTAVFSRMLYQLSYLGARVPLYSVSVRCQKKMRCSLIIIDEQDSAGIRARLSPRTDADARR